MSQFYGIKNKKQVLVKCDQGHISSLWGFGAVRSSEEKLYLTDKEVSYTSRGHSGKVKKMKLPYSGEELFIGHSYCGRREYLKKEDDCSDMMDSEAVIKKFNEKCKGNSNCEFSLNDPSFINFDNKN